MADTFRSYCDVAVAKRRSVIAIFAAISSSVSAVMPASWQQRVDAGHRPAGRARFPARFPARFADLDALSRMPRPAHSGPVAGSLKTSNRFLESMVVFKAARAGGC